MPQGHSKQWFSWVCKWAVQISSIIIVIGFWIGCGKKMTTSGYESYTVWGFFSFRRCYTLSHFYDFSHSNQRLKPWKDSCATAWIVSNEQMKFCFSCKLMQHLWHFCFALNYNNKINSTSLYVQLASVFFLYKTLPFRLCSLSDSHNKFSMIFNEYKILYIKD